LKRFLLTAGAVLGFVGLLVYMTLAQRGFECRVCMESQGNRHCTTVSAPTREEAYEAAKRGACGTASNSVTSDLECMRQPTLSEECSG